MEVLHISEVAHYDPAMELEDKSAFAVVHNGEVTTVSVDCNKDFGLIFKSLIEGFKVKPVKTKFGLFTHWERV